MKRTSKHIEKKGDTFYVSASQLIAYHQCPARYAFTRRLASLRPPAHFIADGIAGHALMAREERLPVGINARVIRLVERTRNYMDKHYEIDVGNVELEQELGLRGDIQLLRKIDALAEDDLGRVVIDYKFVGSQWDVIPELGLAPKAAGFQSKCYLIPPPETDWPDRIHYVVVSDDALKVYKYSTRPDDLKEVVDASVNMKTAWDAQRLPRNEGYACHSYCPFRAPCFGEKDWESDFKSVENDPYSRDVRYRNEETQT